MKTMTSAPLEGPCIPKGAEEGSPSAPPHPSVPSGLITSSSPLSKSQRLAQGHAAGGDLTQEPRP